MEDLFWGGVYDNSSQKKILHQKLGATNVRTKFNIPHEISVFAKQKPICHQQQKGISFRGVAYV